MASASTTLPTAHALLKTVKSDTFTKSSKISSELKDEKRFTEMIKSKINNKTNMSIKDNSHEQASDLHVRAVEQTGSTPQLPKAQGQHGIIGSGRVSIEGITSPASKARERTRPQRVQHTNQSKTSIMQIKSSESARLNLAKGQTAPVPAPILRETSDQKSLLREGTFEKEPDSELKHDKSVSIPVITSANIKTRKVSPHGSSEPLRNNVPSNIATRRGRVDKHLQSTRQNSDDLSETSLYQTDRSAHSDQTGPRSNYATMSFDNGTQQFIDKIKELKGENNVLREQNNLALIDLKDLREENDRVRRDVDERRTQIVAEKEETLRMKADSLTIASKLSDAEIEVCNLNKLVNEIRKKNEIADTELKNEKSNGEKLKKEKDSLNFEVHKFSRENKSLRTKLKESETVIEKDKDEFRSLIEKLNRVTQECELLQKLKLRQASAEETARNIIQKNREIETLKDELISFKQRCHDACVETERKNQVQVAEFTNRILALNKQIDQLMDGNGILLKTLDKERGTVDELRDLNESVRTENKHLQDEIVTQKRDMERDRKTDSDLEKENKSLSDENVRLRRIITDNDTDMINSNADKSVVDDKLRYLEAKQKSANTRVRHLEGLVGEFIGGAKSEETVPSPYLVDSFSPRSVQKPLPRKVKDRTERHPKTRRDTGEETKADELTVTMNYSVRRKQMLQLKKQTQ